MALPVSGVTNDALMAALTDVAWPECNNTYDGFCVENYAKGSVVYYDAENCAESFINLPGINLLPNWLLGCMWGLFLIWTFFGIAIISDAFVAGIEVITAKTHMVKRQDSKGNVVMREEPVWNWAIANITLLAVGSSSPEILLSLVDTIITLNQPAGQIGASTIVGSAAFNLFVIAAVCMVSLPTGTFRKIEHFKVFIWTTSWSLWSYLWLWIVYKQVSPNVIEMWEAWVTLAFMPVFVWTTYMVDTRGWNWFAKHKNSIVSPDETHPDEEEGAEATDRFKLSHSPSQVNKHSILYYRTMVLQNMGGIGHAPRLSSDPTRPLHDGRAMSGRPVDPAITPADIDAMGRDVTKVLLKSPEISVLESVGEARITVLRMHGNLKDTIKVGYTTKDETAVAGLDYVAAEGELVFGPGEESKEIAVKIMDDDMSEPDVVFSVVLTAAIGENGGEVKLLRRVTTVTIVDDDDGGVVMFELPTQEAGIQDGCAEVVVIRRHGADGAVSIDYATKDGSALSGKHFSESHGRLEFDAGQVRKVIQVPLLPVAADPSMVVASPAFRMVLTNPMGGVVLGTRKECRVVLVQGSAANRGGGGGAGSAGGDDEELSLWSAWQDQFKDAVLPEYDEEEGDLWMTIILHYISITYKLIAACIPPADWMDGYPCFVMALVLLGLLMAIVKEVAEMFGCSMGLSDVMTGMSIVALGTSLPDTFASRLACLNDDNADAAIGNIMGSNTCNVLLGLGIPWVIAASYYEAKDEVFFSESGALGFSLMIFFILSVGGIGALLFRRYTSSGELGAEKRSTAWALGAFQLGLWLLFLLLSGLNDYGHISSVGL